MFTRNLWCYLGLVLLSRFLYKICVSVSNSLNRPWPRSNAPLNTGAPIARSWTQPRRRRPDWIFRQSSTPPTACVISCASPIPAIFWVRHCYEILSLFIGITNKWQQYFVSNCDRKLRVYRYRVLDDFNGFLHATFSQDENGYQILIWFENYRAVFQGRVWGRL